MSTTLIQYQDDRLTVFESALYRTTTTVVSAPKFNLLVDPNWLPVEIDAIRAHLVALGDKPLVMLFTHSDYDHIIGYRAFKPHLVIASQNFVDSPDREKNLEQIREFDDRYYIRRNYAIDYPLVDIPVKTDGQTLTLGECEFTFYLAPGHTADGLFTVIEPYGYFIAGDYLSNVEFPFIYHDSREYLKTLRKAAEILNGHKIERMIPGHGDLAYNPTDVQKRITDSIAYVEALREAVLEAKPFDLESWLSKYDFPGGLAKAHLDNEQVVKKELLG